MPITIEQLHAAVDACVMAFGKIPMEWRMSKRVHDAHVVGNKAMPSVSRHIQIQTLLGYPVIIDEDAGDYIRLQAIDPQRGGAGSTIAPLALTDQPR